jgi:hypothetical protein
LSNVTVLTCRRALLIGWKNERDGDGIMEKGGMKVNIKMFV